MLLSHEAQKTSSTSKLMTATKNSSLARIPVKEPLLNRWPLRVQMTAVASCAQVVARTVIGWVRCGTPPAIALDYNDRNRVLRWYDAYWINVTVVQIAKVIDSFVNVASKETGGCGATASHICDALHRSSFLLSFIIERWDLIEIIRIAQKWRVSRLAQTPLSTHQLISILLISSRSIRWVFARALYPCAFRAMSRHSSYLQ